MKVLFATAEFAPLASVGGLAQASAGLVKELRRQGVDVIVAIPDYFGTELIDETVVELDVPQWAAPARARYGQIAGIGKVVLIHSAGIRRAHPYLHPDGTGWPDNDRRFFAFSAALVDLCRRESPDVLHLNDWHTAMTLALADRTPPSVLTIHTLGYQGTTDLGWLSNFGSRASAFEWHRVCNPLAGAIRISDIAVTVSPSYAAEVLSPEMGFGLDELLRDKGEYFLGIINGIDTEIWDPANDDHLPAEFSLGEPRGKKLCTAKLRAEMGLPDSRGPMITMVTRLADQKGVDLALASVPYLDGMGAQLAILGSGDSAMASRLRAACAAHPNTLAFREGYDDGLSHRLFAGGDLFLMPSRFEPCGLAQMQAMRYGAAPVACAVGGLRDTIIDIDASPTRGTGVLAAEASALAVLDGLHRATRAWTSKPRREAMRKRGMSIDWSWSVPTKILIGHYERIKSARG